MSIIPLYVYHTSICLSFICKFICGLNFLSSIHLFIIHQFVCNQLNVYHPSVSLSSISLFIIHMFVYHPSVCVSICKFIIHLFVYHPSVCLSICRFIIPIQLYPGVWKRDRTSHEKCLEQSGWRKPYLQ